MDEIYLTVKEVSELKGCTERYVQTLIERKKLSYTEIDGQATGRGGIQYRIPLSALDKKLQVKYKRLQREISQSNIETAPASETVAVNYEDLTESEREQITFWKGIIREWDMFRATAARKTDSNEQFILFIQEKWKTTPPPFNIALTVQTLYRKRKDLYAKGEAALIDGRGKHNNHVRKLTDEMLDIFEYYYLDASQKSVSLCAFCTQQELNRRYETVLQIPSKDTFERAAKQIPIPYVMYFRHRKIEFIGKCAPYIKRMYDLEPNDIWVADNHTFDIMVNKGGKPVRLYLTAFMDVKTRKIVGWCVTDNPGADATVYALKKGIERVGAPKMILCDNGHEFLFHDFGGNGFRKTAKLKPGEFKPPSILDDLEINFTTALPANARAKGVERAFGTLKEHFSKLFDSYTGGNVLEKPDRLKQIVKKPELLVNIDEFNRFVDMYITGYYNKQPHSGEGMWGRSPDEAFAEEIYEKRIVPPDKLNLMFMRYSKDTMKVGKNGVTITLYGQKLQYFSADLWREYFGREVYVRYSPDNLNTVRVYNTDKQFICEAPLKTNLGFDATKEQIQAMQHENNAAVKKVKNYINMKGIEAQSALDAVLNKAAENLEIPYDIDPKVFKVLQSDEQPLLKAAGADNEFSEPIDWTSAIKKLKADKSINK